MMEKSPSAIKPEEAARLLAENQAKVAEARDHLADVQRDHDTAALGLAMAEAEEAEEARKRLEVQEMRLANAKSLLMRAESVLRGATTVHAAALAQAEENERRRQWKRLIAVGEKRASLADQIEKNLAKTGLLYKELEELGEEQFRIAPLSEEHRKRVASLFAVSRISERFRIALTRHGLKGGRQWFGTSSAEALRQLTLVQAVHEATDNALAYAPKDLLPSRGEDA